MDIRGGGDGGTSHTKNPNQIFPIIYTLSSKYLYLSRARARSHAFLRWYVHSSPRISTNETFRGNDESNKSWKSTIPTLAKNLSRAVTRLFYLASLDHVTGTLLLYIRDAVPTFSRFLFRCHRNFVREPPFLRPTPNLAHARFVPPLHRTFTSRRSYRFELSKNNRLPLPRTID